MSRLPSGVVLLVMRRFIVLTAISALQLEWGKATEDSRWCIPQSRKNWRVAEDVNSGPLSVAHSSGFQRL